MRDLGSRLRSLRLARGMTLRGVEEASGVSNAYVSQLESGAVANPSMRVLKRLSDAFGVPLWQLSGETDDLPPLICAADAISVAQDLSEAERREVAEFIRFVQWRRKGGRR